jgi:hypothetical protein
MNMFLIYCGAALAYRGWSPRFPAAAAAADNLVYELAAAQDEFFSPF